MRRASSRKLTLAVLLHEVAFVVIVYLNLLSEASL